MTQRNPESETYMWLLSIEKDKVGGFARRLINSCCEKEERSSGKKRKAKAKTKQKEAALKPTKPTFDQKTKEKKREEQEEYQFNILPPSTQKD
jgi:hypothetical protein